MKKSIIIYLIVVFYLASCQSDNNKYWFSVYPIFHAGGILVEHEDSICYKHIQYPDNFECSSAMHNDSLFNSNNEWIGKKEKDRIIVFGFDRELYYIPFKPRKLDIPYDSVFSILTGNSWEIKQGKYNYRLDFLKNVIDEYDQVYTLIRYKVDPNDSIIMPWRLWDTQWYLRTFADTYILAINYIGLNHYQFFKITRIDSKKIDLESINEYDEDLFETDTLKPAGQFYSLDKLVKKSGSELDNVKSVFKGPYRIEYLKSDLIPGDINYGGQHQGMHCDSTVIQSIIFKTDTLIIRYTSDFERKHRFSIDKYGNYLILDNGEQEYDFFKYNLSDSTLEFYDRRPIRCDRKRRDYKILDTKIKLQK